MPLFHRAFVVLAWSASVFGGVVADDAGMVDRSHEGEVLRLGFTNAMFSGVNESDAKASIRALATTIARERGLAADPEPHLFRDWASASAALQHGMINAIGLTTVEYATVREHNDFAGFVFSVYDGKTQETYVLLTAAADSAMTLTDLRGRDLAVLVGPRMSVALAWLDLELARQGLPASAQYFRRRIVSGKPSKIILPVFFKQVAACLVTERAFDTMAELNPQVRRDMRVIATSPPYVPSFFAVKGGLPAPFLHRILREFSRLHTTTAGKQVLTIFQTDQVSAGAAETLEPTLAMLDEFGRIGQSADAGQSRPTSP